MGGALQAIARSSPARGARMEGREGRKEQRGRKEVPGRVGLRVGTELLHNHIWPREPTRENITDGVCMIIL